MAGSPIVEARKLKGFQDFDPIQTATRNRFKDIVRKHAQLGGFREIETPTLEYADVLLGSGGETDKQVFKFLDNGAREVALRYDLTVPFARYVAENQGTLSLPFKRLQIGNVFRAEKPQKGRFREFCQCDLDIIGVDSPEADTEILLCLFNALSEISPFPFTMSLGHRGILSSAIRVALKPSSLEVETEILILVDKMDKLPAAEVCNQIKALPGIYAKDAELFVEALANQKNQNQQQLLDLLESDSESRKLLESLYELAAMVSAASAGKNSIKVDLSIARGLGYYTGVVFETRLDGFPGFGAICSGGRYNHLVEKFSNHQVAGVGGSIGLDRFIAKLAEEGLLDKEPELTAFVAVASPAQRAYAFSVLNRLRAKQCSTTISLKEQKLGQQFKKANSLGCKFVVVIGASEEAEKTVTVKNMSTGVELKETSFEQMFAFIHA